MTAVKIINIKLLIIVFILISEQYIDNNTDMHITKEKLKRVQLWELNGQQCAHSWRTMQICVLLQKQKVFCSEHVNIFCSACSIF